MMFLLVCMNSDGLEGFDLSHNGYWLQGRTYVGSKTKMECANTCLLDCVAIDTSANTCYHYMDGKDVVSTNDRYDSVFKAYIKCTGAY